MRTKARTLTAIAAAALGGTALAGACCARRRGGGPDLLDGGRYAKTAAENFAAVDAGGGGALARAGIDKLRNDRHAAHDADSDGSPTLDEFSGLRRETARPPTARAFQILDTDGDGIAARAEYDRPLAGVVEWFDRNGDGRLPIGEGRDGDDDDRRGRRRDGNLARSADGEAPFDPRISIGATRIAPVLPCIAVRAVPAAGEHSGIRGLATPASGRSIIRRPRREYWTAATGRERICAPRRSERSI